MKHETSGLTGVFLNAGVAKARGHNWAITGDTVFADWCTEEQGRAPYHPSTGPAVGLPILKAAGIPYSGDLAADMRVYVESVFGEHVEL